jgi:hypothetical protein
LAAEAFEQLASCVYNEATILCGIHSCWRIGCVAEWAATSKRLAFSLMCLPIHPSQYGNDIQAAAKIGVINPWHGDTQFESRMGRCFAA